jgi:nitrogenase-associated protein
MANIVFYEKPGCINNSKQKKLLIDAGHQVDSRNLLTAPWSRAALLDYFSSMAVGTWFNSSAPDIKSGKIKPSALSEDRALQLMIDNPILIRRPLIRVGDECRAGFDYDSVEQWIGLAGTNPDDAEKLGGEDLETCQQRSGHRCASPDNNESDNSVAANSMPANSMPDTEVSR